MVRQFIDGLKNVEDRMSMLTRRLTTLEECYELATMIQGARAVSKDEHTQGGYKERQGKYKDYKAFKKLDAAAKKKAQKEGACLECGKMGHWWRVCKDLKPKAYQMDNSQRSRGQKGKKQARVCAAAEEESKEEPTKDEEEEESEDSSDRTESPNEELDSSEGEESS